VRIAHLSDLHLLDLQGAVPGRLLNKRITGYVNIRAKRGSIHKEFAVRAIAAAIRREGVDHVAITGDVSNLSLEKEFDLVCDVLDRDLGLSPDDVSLVPGNHDAYTRGAVQSRRFQRYFARYLRSDLDVAEPGQSWPCVKLRGRVAFIGLSTAVPRPPLVASGQLGAKQLQGLERALRHPEVKERTVVVLQHHPIINPTRWAKVLFEGLLDAKAEVNVLSSLTHGLVLHGHLHRRSRKRLPTRGGHLDVLGATSASLLHDSDERCASFNIYEVDDAGGLVSLSTRCLSLDEPGDDLLPNRRSFREIPLNP